MKLSKKQIGLIAGLACAILLIVLLLTMCNGSGYGDHQSEPTESSAPVESTAPVEESTEALDETTEATEETTEETEEPTEETTEPTTGSTGGNTRPGGTGGYNPGTGNNNNDSSSGGTTAEKAPAAGSADSPYVEAVPQFPDDFSSVAIPSGGTVYYHVYGAEGGELTIADGEAYVIYNEKTYEPDAYGIVTVPMPEKKPDTGAVTADNNATDAETDTDTETVEEILPVSFQLGSKSAETRSFVVSVNAPLGTLENPNPVEAVDGMISIESALEAGDEDGCYFSYTALSNGRLVIQVDSVTENIGYDVIVTIGEQTLKLSECEDGVLSSNIFTDDIVLIQIIAIPGEDGKYPAAEFSVMCQIEDTSGSRENPIDYIGELPIVTDALEPGAEVYYNVYGVGDMILTVNDPDAYVIVNEETLTAVDGIVSGVVEASNPRMPVVIGIGNGGESAESYTVEFQYKLGHMMNPDQLLIDASNTAVIGAGTKSGYWYTWTATEDGILTVTMPEGNWMYQINNMTSFVYGDTQYSDAEDAAVLSETVVAAGDELNILVATYDPENSGVMPDGEIVFSAAFTTKVGTQNNPLWLTEMENNVLVKPGETFYCNEVMSGVTMTITGEGTFTVTYNGSNYAAADGVVTIADVTGTRFAPTPVLLSNYTEEEVAYTVTFTYPMGSSSNPQIIELMGDYSAPVKGDGEGYFYSWTASADGEFTVTMLGDDWSYVMDNMTSSLYGERQVSSDGGNSSETMEVKAGDVIQINVSTASAQSKDVPLNFDFYDPTYGTAENPVWLTDMDNTVTVRPGTTVYANVPMSGVTMTISGTDAFVLTFNGTQYSSENGAVIIHDVAGTRFAPLQLCLTNSGAEAVQYIVAYAYPLGSSSNPEKIVEMREYTASVVGDSAGYFFSWTAETDGVFTITMNSDDWTYVVNNLTTSSYGDIQKSAENAPATATIEVKSGDQIEVNIGTSSGQNKDVAVEFDAYDPNTGTEENPVWLFELEQTVTVRPDSPVYCNVMSGGVTMIVTGEGNYAVTFNGVGYPVVNGAVTIADVNASRFMPQQLILTNFGEKKTDCTVTFVYPVGNMENPQVLTEMGAYTASVKTDFGGYFFTFTAQEDGNFTISLEGNDWIYSMYNLTTGIHNGNRDSMFGDAATQTIAVKAGDEIQINIGTSSFTDKDVSLTFAFEPTVAVLKMTAEPTVETKVFEGNYTPKTFEIDVEKEVQSMGQVDLTQTYELVPSKAGIYHLHSKKGPLVLLDFTDDTYVNLKELVASREIFVKTVAADGSAVSQSCNELLQKYIDCAWTQKISEEETRTLYPLTEDLELILKALAEELGWFDPDSEGYLFTEEALPASDELTEPQTQVALQEDSLWMFACHWVEFIGSETTQTQEESVEETEAVVEPSEEPALETEAETA